jgi:hypothetical protein
MSSYIRFARAAALAVSVAAIGASCNTSDILQVEDPDIVNPENVQSAAGANAVRLGALGRFNSATSGDESLFLLGGLMADEWINGDSFIARQEIDQRVITPENTFLLSSNRIAHRARVAAGQAVDLLKKYVPNAPAYQVAEMYFVQAYIENILAEHYCNGLVFSNIVDGAEVYGEPVTNVAAFERALGHVNEGIAALSAGATDTASLRVANGLAVVKGRILLNLNRPAEAAQAVASVPTSFRYNELHASTSTSNSIWSLNNSARRYSVSPGEGPNGIPFATAGDPRVPVCTGGDTPCKAIGVTNTQRDDLARPFYVQMLWPARETSVAILSGVDARLIEAEAQLRAGNSATMLTTLNALRAATGTGSGGVAGLTALADAGTQTARENQLFREKAFWQFSRGMRLGDLRRLVRQYNRTEAAVFPTGPWQKGGNYGTDVSVPMPQAELNNPNVPQDKNSCLDRQA